MRSSLPFFVQAGLGNRAEVFTDQFPITQRTLRIGLQAHAARPSGRRHSRIADITRELRDLPALSAPALAFPASTGQFAGQLDIGTVERQIVVEHAVSVAPALTAT